MSRRKTQTPSREAAAPAPVRMLEHELVEEIEEIAASTGCELAHAEYKGGVLRLFIDRPDGGVDISDCERVSKQVSALLDVLDFSEGRYLLEVSSPGLDRQLYRPKDWRRFTGKKVKVTYVDPESRKKRTVVGRLESFEPLPEGAPAEEATGGRAHVMVEDGRADGNEERLDLSLDDVQVARLEIEL